MKRPVGPMGVGDIQKTSAPPIKALCDYILFLEALILDVPSSCDMSDEIADRIEGVTSQIPVEPTTERKEG